MVCEYNGSSTCTRENYLTSTVGSNPVNQATQSLPDVNISTSHPASGNVPVNSSNNILAVYQLTVSNSTATLNSISLTTGGTYAGTDIATNGFKFWINSAANLSGAVQLGTSQAAVGNAGTVAVSGLTQNFAVGTSYILLTANISSGAVVGNVISINSAAFSSIIFSTGTKSGTDPASASNNQTIVIAPPTQLAITGVSPATPYANGLFDVTVQSQTGLGNPSNVVLGTDVSLSNTGGGTFLGTLNGTIAAGTNSIVISNVSLTASGTGIVITAHRTAGDALSDGTATINVLSQAPTSAASNIVFGTVTATTIPITSWTNGNGASRLVVARLFGTTRVGPADGSGYTANSLSFTDVLNPQTGSGNVVVYNGGSSPITVTGLSGATQYSFDIYEQNGSGSLATYFYAGTATNSAYTAFPTINFSSNHPAAGNIGLSSTNDVIGGFILSVTNLNATLTGLSVTTAGSYVTGDVNNFKLWYSTSGTFAGAVQLGSTAAAAASGSNISFGSLSQTINSGSTGYLFVTTDINSGATLGHQIDLTSTSFANFTFGSTISATGTNPVPASNLQTIVTSVNYRSANAAGGTWSVGPDWERFNGTAWVTASAAPTSTDGLITIRSGYNMNIAASMSADELTIDNGATLTLSSGTFTLNDGSGTDMTVNGIYKLSGGTLSQGAATIAVNSGGKYQHNIDGGVIPTCSWNTGSTCEITGFTTTNVNLISSFTQNYYNFTWNCAGQTSNIQCGGLITTVNGDLTIGSTGASNKDLRLFTNGASGTLNVGGSVYLNGGLLALTNSGSNGSGTGTLNIGGQLSIASGAVLDMTGSAANTASGSVVNLSGNLTISGTGKIQRTQSTPSTFNFSGNNATQIFTSQSNGINANNITFNAGDGTHVTTVQLASGFGMSTNSHLNVLNNAILDCSTYIVSGGNFAVNAGGKIITANTGGIASSIGVSGTATFTAGADYEFNSTVAAQNTGFSTLSIGNPRNITISNNTSGGVTQDGTNYDMVISGALTVNSGAVFIVPNLNNFNKTGAATVVINGTIKVQDANGYSGGANTLFQGFSAGDFTYDPNAVVDYNGTTQLVTSQSLLPYPNLTFSNSGTKTATGPFDVNRHVIITGTANFNGVSYTFHVGGNWSNSATFTAGTSLVDFNGAAAQQINGTTVFQDLSLDNSNGLTLNADNTVGGTLTFGSGLIHTGSNKLIVTNSATGALSGYGVAKYLDGTLRRFVNASGSYDFPVGSSGNYELINLNLNALSGTSYIDAFFNTTIGGNAPNPATCQINGTEIVGLLDAGIWTMTPDNEPGAGTIDITLHERGQSNSVTPVTRYGVINRANVGADWEFDGIHHNNTQSESGGEAIAVVSGVTHLSDWGFGFGGGAPLPVVFTSFDAKAVGQQEVNLNWVTSAELNTGYFEVERSKDGVQFEKIGTVAAAGFSEVSLQYAMEDTHAWSGLSYYRLHEFDLDGKQQYSEIRAVDLGSVNTFETSTLIGSQVSVNIATEENGNAMLLVSGMNGAVLLEQPVVLQRGMNRITLPLSDLPAGMYLLSLRSSTGVVTRKIVKP